MRTVRNTLPLSRPRSSMSNHQLRGESGFGTNSGSFKAHVKSASDATLSAPGTDTGAPASWGAAPQDPAAIGREYGWTSHDEHGNEQFQVSEPAEGITRYDFPEHGCFALSPERNAAIPAAMRNEDGIYEEDVESLKVVAYHPDSYPNMVERIGEEQTRQIGVDGCKNWFPTQYAAATGHEFALGESHEVDRHDWFAKNTENYVAISAVRTDQPDTVQVTVAKGGDRENGERVVLFVPADDYEAPNAPHGTFEPPFHVTAQGLGNYPQAATV